ncbi:ABC transporter permease [Plantactinospora sp. S1510]|uniref:ABC transporter permease n=1 Tax=Plantactinospora alkalitolerans TaxID=2789879 RepID=A0ABS0GWF9_9ACTN|nr:ABC transporter permease [Plantactinospora alkalitolerans]MBF9130530.1 ABC transporter permease [Plantactinospora alkalitolerans]
MAGLAKARPAGGVAPERPPTARQLFGALPRRRPSGPPGTLLALRTPLPGRIRTLLVLASVAVPLLVWLVLGASGAVEPRFLPAPGAVWTAGVEMARSGELVTDAWATVRRILYGYGLGVAVAVPLGVAMGSFTAARSALEPVSGLLRYLPAAAFTPLLLIWLGIGESPKIALIFIGTVFFNMLMVADAVRQVPLELVNVSYTLGARRGEVLGKVILPYALPGIVDAVRVNFAAAWGLVVVAELVNSQEGLGKRILLAQRFTQTDKIFAILVVIGLIGVTADVALRITRDRIGRWVP